MPSYLAACGLLMEPVAEGFSPVVVASNLSLLNGEAGETTERGVGNVASELRFGQGKKVILFGCRNLRV